MVTDAALLRVFSAAVAIFCCLMVSPAGAQTPAQAARESAFQFVVPPNAPSALSRDCQVSCAAFSGPSPLRNTSRAIRMGQPVRVMAIGSSSTVGVGASTPRAGYTPRLEADLERMLKGIDVVVIPRGISGETAVGAAKRMQQEVAAARPDLVIWQVGTNDGMTETDGGSFSELVRSTVRMLRAERIDVVLIDPQYVERLAQDAAYMRIVRAVATIAREERVLLVNRFETMADLARHRGNATFLASDKFHLNDLGYRCMSEYAARAIVAGLVQADRELAAQN